MQLKIFFYIKIIKGVNRQDIVTHTDETINLALFEDGSVCSCDDINNCYRLYSNRLNKKRGLFLKNIIDNKRYFSERNTNKRVKFTVLRQPCSIFHLSNHLNKDGNSCGGTCDLIIKQFDKYELEIKRLAIESDFIINRIIERRVSI